MSNNKLINQVNEAFSSGDNQHGLELLRKYLNQNPADAGSWHRLANIEEQIGDWGNAGRAHYQCIQTAPSNPLAYMYAGYWLQQSGHTDAAAAAYSLTQDIDPNHLQLWRVKDTAQQTALRSREADSLLRKTLSHQHRALFKNEPEKSRVADATWVRTHDLPLVHQTADFAPALFFIPELDQKPWFEREDLEWSGQLESNSELIRQELHAALRKSPEALGTRPYLPEDTRIEGKMAALVGSDNWSAIDLYRDGEINSKAAKEFPRTLEIIEQLPTYGIDDQPFEVFFSLLQPGWSIDDHFGLSNHSLTCHIGLEIPDDCYIEVAHQQRCWQQGELLAFDDSYLHSAHNKSSQRRIVLIFSIWHPSLNSQERADVQRAFKCRQRWMAARRDKLEKLVDVNQPD